MELPLKLRAVIGLDDFGPNLIILLIDLQDAKPGAIVDGRILVIKFPVLRDSLQELDINLDPMPGHGLLVSLPTFQVSLISLIDRKPAHLQLVEDPPDAGAADVDIMIAFKINHDFPGPKMVGLPQIDDLS